MGHGLETSSAGLFQHADLVARGLHYLGRRPDEDDARRLAGADKIRVLGQKAIAGMDGIHALRLGNGQDRVRIHEGVMVGKLNARIGQPHMERIAVANLVQSHGADAHLAARTDDAYRDLAAVSDEYLFEHVFCVPSTLHTLITTRANSHPWSGAGRPVPVLTSAKCHAYEAHDALAWTWQPQVNE